MHEPTADDQSQYVRFPLLECATFLLLALAVVYQLFFDPIIGLASNGDYWRMTEPVGLYYADPPDDENAHLVRTYESGESEDWAGYRSSELLLVQTALAIDRAYSSDQLFDIRVVGAVHSTFYLLGAGILLAAARRFSVIPRIALSVLLLLVFSDVAYVSYFNSFYSEPASIIFLMLTAGFGLMLISGEQNARWHPAWIVLFFLSAALFITAKPQNGPLGIPLAMIGYRLSGGPVSLSWQHYRPHLLAAGLGVALAIIGLVTPFVAHPKAFQEANLFNVVFAEMLGNSDNPERDLRAMGLDEDLVEYAGTHAYQPGSPVTEESFHPRFFDHIGYQEIALFYLQHPARFLDLMSRGAEHTAAMRPDYLGNFEESTGQPPRARSEEFATWSNRKSQLFPSSLLFLAVFVGVSLGISGWVHQRYRDVRSLRLASEFHITLLLMAGMQFVLVLLGEGEFEIVKHLFVYHALFDMALLVLALLIAIVASKHLRRIDRRERKARTPWNR